MTDDLLERRCHFIYDAARVHALTSHAPIVPEAWADRDDAFRDTFREVILQQCSADPAVRYASPEAAHASWWTQYEEMGWGYGPVRDAEQKTHPDMVPFADLEPREQAKDAVFLALCDIARQWICEDADPFLAPRVTPADFAALDAINATAERIGEDDTTRRQRLGLDEGEN